MESLYVSFADRSLLHWLDISVSVGVVSYYVTDTWKSVKTPRGKTYSETPYLCASGLFMLINDESRRVTNTPNDSDAPTIAAKSNSEVAT